jgi:hypothetical protein
MKAIEGISIDAGMFSFEFRGKHIVTAAFLGVLIGSFGTYFVLKQNKKLLPNNQKAIA